MNNPYRSPNAQVAISPASGSLVLLCVGVALSALPAAACSLVVGQFREVLAGFGADLPLLTQLLFAHSALLWILPCVAATAAFLSPRHARGRRGLLLGVLCAFIVLPICVYALYMPIFKLAAVTG